MFRIVCWISKQSPLVFSCFTRFFYKKEKSSFGVTKQKGSEKSGNRLNSSMKSPLNSKSSNASCSSFRLPIVSHQMCKLLPNNFTARLFPASNSCSCNHPKISQSFSSQISYSPFRQVQEQFLYVLRGCQKQPKKTDALHFIMFKHSLHSDFVTHVSLPGYSTVKPSKRTTTLYVSAPRKGRPKPKASGKITVDSMGKKHLEKIPCLPCSVGLLFRILLVAWPLLNRVPNVSKENLCQLRRKNPVNLPEQKNMKTGWNSFFPFLSFLRGFVVKSFTSSMLRIQKPPEKLVP